MPSLLKRICSVGTRHNPFEASLVISVFSTIRELSTEECEANLTLSLEAGPAQPLPDNQVMSTHDSLYVDIQSSLGTDNNTLSTSAQDFEVPPPENGEASTAVVIGRRLARDSMAIIEFTGSLYETPRGVKMYREKAEEDENA